MSNLLKQYYVTNPTGTVRVIDSNKRADIAIKEHAVIGFQPLSFSSFDGPSDEQNENEKVTEENESTSISEENEVAVAGKIQDMLDAAQKQADSIVLDAQNQAKRILIEANKKAERIFDDNKKKGYEEGSNEKLADVMKMQENVENEIQTRREKLESEYQQKSDEMESDIVDAIIKVFDKVFKIQFDDKKEMLLHLIKNTLMNVEVGKEFRIHVSQNNYKFINSHLDDVKQNIGNDVNVEVVNDASLGTGDCHIETNFGVFDCGIDMELNNLIKDIKSLCS